MHATVLCHFVLFFIPVIFDRLTSSCNLISKPFCFNDCFHAVFSSQCKLILSASEYCVSLGTVIQPRFMIHLPSLNELFRQSVLNCKMLTVASVVFFQKFCRSIKQIYKVFLFLSQHSELYDEIQTYCTPC